MLRDDLSTLVEPSAPNLIKIHSADPPCINTIEIQQKKQVRQTHNSRFQDFEVTDNSDNRTQCVLFNE